jgi:hypothetical protein
MTENGTTHYPTDHSKTEDALVEAKGKGKATAEAVPRGDDGALHDDDDEDEEDEEEEDDDEDEVC